MTDRMREAFRNWEDRQLYYGKTECRNYALRAFQAGWQARDAEGWQPISTAPRDGTYVVITDGEEAAVARYDVDTGRWWDKENLDFNYGNWDSELTHWMPLPQPPSKQEAE